MFEPVQMFLILETTEASLDDLADRTPIFRVKRAQSYAEFKFPSPFGEGVRRTGEAFFAYFLF